jgi:hypothetical protein
VATSHVVSVFLPAKLALAHLLSPHKSGIVNRGQLPVGQPLAHHLKQRLVEPLKIALEPFVSFGNAVFVSAPLAAREPVIFS